MLDLRTGVDRVHPCVGGLDLVSLIHLDEREREMADAVAEMCAASIGEDAELPVVRLRDGGHSLAEVRRGGVTGLAARIAAGEIVPDAGPPHVDLARGAVLLAVEPPSTGVNFELGPDHDGPDALALAARLSGPGVLTLGSWLRRREVPQVSCRIAAGAPVRAADLAHTAGQDADVARAELVHPCPLGALDGFPEGIAVENPTYAMLVAPSAS